MLPTLSFTQNLEFWTDLPAAGRVEKPSAIRSPCVLASDAVQLSRTQLFSFAQHHSKRQENQTMTTKNSNVLAVVATLALSWAAHSIASGNWTTLTTGYGTFPRVLARTAAVAPALLFALFLAANRSNRSIRELALSAAFGTHLFYLLCLLLKVEVQDYYCVLVVVFDVM